MKLFYEHSIPEAFMPEVPDGSPDLAAMSKTLRQMHENLLEMERQFGLIRPPVSDDRVGPAETLDLSAWGDPIEFPSIEQMLKDLEEASRR